MVNTCIYCGKMIKGRNYACFQCFNKEKQGKYINHKELIKKEQSYEEQTLERNY